MSGHARVQDLRRGDVIVDAQGRPDRVVAAPPRAMGEYVLIDVRDVRVGGLARSNRRHESPVYTITRNVDELVEINRGEQA